MHVKYGDVLQKCTDETMRNVGLCRFAVKMSASACSYFLYFSFGSNLSSQRINMNSPSAEFMTVARLTGYVMQFCGHSSSWKGGTATICEEEKGEVWGVVWRISNNHSEALDR